MPNTQQQSQKQPTGEPPLLPSLCEGPAILRLVLLGELLALVLALMAAEQSRLWEQLGVLSMVVQWIMLGSALVLCQLRPHLNRLAPVLSASLAYLLCLVVAAGVLAVAPMVINKAFELQSWARAMVIAGIVAGVVLRYLYLQQQVSNQQQAELRSRLQSLQSRIRPHFLFNSMNTIASLIAIDPQRAERAVESLSALFRSSLQEMGYISLEEELEICRRYIEIESLRLADRLDMRWQLEAPLPPVSVPSLLLQPLLENAIVHGIQPLPQGGQVSVAVSSVDDHIDIRIVNPLPSPRASGSNRATADKGQHMALENIRHRLQLYYRHQADLRVEAEEGQFRVTLRLPKAAPQATELLLSRKKRIHRNYKP